MARTFEEEAGAELDGLWAGALFLLAGDEDRAARLVQATLVRAAAVFVCRSQNGTPGAWLADRMVRTFLAEEAVDDEVVPPSESRDDGPPRSTPTSDPLHQAAGATPPTARAALWLVLFQRRSYVEAQEVLGVERHELLVLLEAQTELHRVYRATLTAADPVASARRRREPR